MATEVSLNGLKRYRWDRSGEPVRDTGPAKDWLIWYEGFDRQVAMTEVGGVRVSTIFTGFDLDLNRPAAEPALFETMIFGCPGIETGDYQERCGTVEGVWQQHRKAVEEVRRRLKAEREKMTPDRFEAEMRKIAAIDDVERRHSDGDDLMCRVLTELGFGAGVAVFKQTTKYYA